MANTELVGVRRAHAVAAVIEDATSQNGWRTFEPDLPRDGIGDELGLHGLEKLQVEDGSFQAILSQRLVQKSPVRSVMPNNAN
jgi:hypothetical protein